MLLGDRCFAALPALSELLEIREDHIGQHSLDCRFGEELVEHRLRPRLVEGVEGGGKLGRAVAGRRGDGATSSSAERAANAAASAAANPLARCRCISRTRLRSSAEYKRSPPGERVGRRSPYRRSHARRSSGLTPERRLSSPIRRRPPSDICALYSFYTKA